ncbi:DUF3533 domain-containing protein [Prauserella marina]|uniref:ABC transporter permease n=1 Tax=Prauserella marina TaxID=530584 RepID=UPI000B8DA711|nr:ABC transporter permease [Prauserella marina]ASR35002.1 DUF3533 domain-containing protein [Prauserella marina]
MSTRHRINVRRSMVRDLWDAVQPRTLLLMLGVLALQLGFILSYVGAFHGPDPHRITLATVAPQATVDQLNAIEGTPLEAHLVADEAQARAQVLDRSADAAFVPDPQGGTDTLLVASAAGPSLATATQQVLSGVEAQQGRNLTTEDLVPPQQGDARALSGFYAMIGWLVGGYLAAAALGVAKGARPATLRRAAIRLGAMVPYSVISGVLGALILDQWLGALTGHFGSLWWLGAALVFVAASVTVALQVLFGIIGIGFTVLIFVVLGNPSAGGAFQGPLLPEFWRNIGGYLPNGAGTEAIRNATYFDGNAMNGPLLVLLVWGLGGLVLTLIGSAVRIRLHGSST